MDASAEQIVLDYLCLLEDAAQRKLSPDERQVFLARSRAAIARQVSETRVADPRDVQRLLRRFGDPHKLAAQERRRLDEAAPASAGEAVPAGADETASSDRQDDHAKGALAPVAAAMPEPGMVAERTAAAGRRAGAAPGLHRPMTARWRPGSDLADAPRPVPPVLRTLKRWPDPPRRAAAARDGEDPVSGSRRRPRYGEEPVSVSRRGPWYGEEADSGGRRSPRGGMPVSAGAASPAGPADGAGVMAAAGVAGSAGGAAAADVSSGVAWAGIARDWVDGLFAIVRSHPFECAAIAVFGVGGLIDPFPLWILGSLLVLVSRLWDTRDKLITVAVPTAIALLGAITLAGLNARTPSLSGYAHGMHTDGWDIIRAAAVLGAIYLTWRLRQGPRPRRGPPWHHITRR